MSEKNGGNATIEQHEPKYLKIVEELFTAHEQGNIQEALTYFTDDVEWRVAMPEELPIGGTFNGRKEVQTFFENHTKMFNIEWEEHSETVTQGNKFVLIGRERAHIMPHNKIYEADYVMAFYFRGNKISKCYVLADSAALLKAYLGE